MPTRATVPSPSERDVTRPLRAGDLVEVRRAEEILATLDQHGALDGLPFMPEMLDFCGRQFPVFRRADKTCDTIAGGGKSRRMQRAVHLEGLRCSGAAHAGCQAGCLLFWKEAWLKRAGPEPQRAVAPRGAARAITVEQLHAATRRTHAGPDELFACQATELNRATTPLRWWEPRQYLRELFSGNVRIGRFIRTLALASYNAFVRQAWRLPVLWRLKPYPHVYGTLKTTPRATLDLQPGEWVRVKPLRQILATLDGGRRNRGLSFDVEMTPYCERTMRVARRVERIIDERTGRVLPMKGDCIVLDGAVCSGHLSHGRLLCPRSVCAYWREIWLERVERDQQPDGPVADA
jgi:hypothetical protein